MSNENRSKAFSGNNEWYTPRYIIDVVRHVLGTIDLDPASSDIANKTVQAARYFTKEQDGLSQPWEGNVFLNPPYSGGLMQKFVDKLVREFLDGKLKQAIVLTNSGTETRWYQKLLSECTAMCVLGKRVRFIMSDGTLGKSPVLGQTLFYFGSHPREFGWNAKQLGTVLLPAFDYEPPMPF